jgi:hypothetical protein
MATKRRVARLFSLLALALVPASASAQLPSLPQTRVRGSDQNSARPPSPRGELGRGLDRACEPSYVGITSDYAFAPKTTGKSPPYDPKGVAADLESQYPGQVSSSTLPPPGSKNVGLAGGRHPSGVVFDQRGFPILDDVAAFDTRLPDSVARIMDRGEHFASATKQLRVAIQRGEVSASRFTAEQLRAIMRGNEKIPGLTWHHHQQFRRMQLVRRRPVNHGPWPAEA